MRITDIDLCISFYSALPKFELLFPQTHQLLFRSHDLINPPPKKKFFINSYIFLRLNSYHTHSPLRCLSQYFSDTMLSPFEYQNSKKCFCCLDS